MRTPKPLIDSFYVEKDTVKITVESAASFLLENFPEGGACFLEWWGNGWVIKTWDSFFCKDKTFKHKNDITGFHNQIGFAMKSEAGNSEWEHVYRTKEEAVELYRTRNLPNVPNTVGFYDKVYDVLEELGGATGEGFRDSFIYNYTKDKYKSDEWRFQGHLGFGGKYRGERNVVDCYPEDETPERLKLIKKINKALKKLADEKGN